MSDKNCVFCNSSQSEHRQENRVREGKVKHTARRVRIFEEPIVGECIERAESHENWELLSDDVVVNLQSVKVTDQGDKAENLAKALEKIKLNPREYLESIEAMA